MTYVARNLEPCRGFHSFMRALPQLLARHPGCEVVIVGGDGVSYGEPERIAPYVWARPSPYASIFHAKGRVDVSRAALPAWLN